MTTSTPTSPRKGGAAAKRATATGRVSAAKAGDAPKFSKSDVSVWYVGNF